MCGLVGIYSMKDNGFSVDEGNMLDQSMIFNQWRGEDSTGLVCINNADGWTYLKAVGGYRALQRHPEWNNFRKEIMNEGRMVFGHGRYATKGTVTNENAHPFRVKRPDDSSLVLIHNGTLEGNQDLPRFYEFPVDSEWLAHMIAEKGAEEALSSIHGAIACMWYDDREKTFNFYRNNERPLYYMCTKAGEFYLNSEVAILEFMNVKYNLKVDVKHIYMLSDHKWHSCKVNGDDTGFKIIDIKPPKRRRKHYSGLIYDIGDEDEGIWQSVLGMPMHTYNKPPEIKDFWDRSHTMIEYIEGKKHIRSTNGVLTIHHNVTPPEPGLLRVYELSNGDIQKVFQPPKPGDNCIFVTCFYKDFVEAQRKNDYPHPATVTKNGVNIRFTTRLAPNNTKIKHNGVLDTKKGYPFLESYNNTRDGSIKVGDKVYVEVTYMEERALSTGQVKIKATCTRVKEEQDAYIDLTFWTSLSKAEIDKSRFFTGTVSVLALQTKDKIKETGTWIIASLRDVYPIQEPTNEQAAIVQAAGTVH